jgi:hypothetical protein
VTFAPGVYAGIPDDVYHADRESLSSSGARKLLPPSTPAEYRYEQDNVRPAKKEFDFGHAAHRLVLGEGSELRPLPESILASNGAASTKEAKAFIAQARADGAVPLKESEYQQASDMAAQVRRHARAAELLEDGNAERSIYWTDPDTGITRRARPDWISAKTIDGRLVLVDYKTSTTANPDLFAKKAADYGYYQQAPWYIDGAVAAGIGDEPVFLFIVQDKNPPYLVSVVELDAEAVREGARLNRRAIRTYARCVEDDHWPGYGDDIIPIYLPHWIYNKQGALE